MVLKIKRVGTADYILDGGDGYQVGEAGELDILKKDGGVIITFSPGSWLTVEFVEED